MAKYTVQPGDTWESIARKVGMYDTTGGHNNQPIWQLVTMNGGHAFTLHHGMQLNITAQPKPATTKDPLTGLSTDQRNAYQTMLSVLGTWDLQSLAPKILQYVQQGYQSDAISYMLSQTPEYKQRFAANDQRIKNGLAPLSPAEYLATERSYRQVLQASGLPATFYDQPSDFQKLLAADISPDELQKRAQYAFQFTNAIDPAYRQAALDYYGVDKAHMAAHFLDPEAAQASLDRQASAIGIGAAAIQQGLKASQGTAEKYADAGMDYATALKGYSQVASVLPQDQNIAAHLGASYTQGQAESEFLGGSAQASRQRSFLEQGEEAMFAANQGNDTRSLNTNAGGGY